MPEGTSCALVEALESRQLLSGVGALLEDINAIGRDSNPGVPVPVDNKLVFVAERPDVGRELFVSDGTSHGTRLLRDLNPGPSSTEVRDIVPLRDGVLFEARDLTIGWGFYFLSLATGDLTRLMSGSSNESAAPVAAKGVGYFYSGFGPDGAGVYRTDGTEAGTSFFGSIGLPRFAKMGDGAYGIWSRPDAPVAALWALEGENAVPLTPADVNAGGNLLAVGDQLLFTGNGSELWASDGTVAGTRQVATVPGSERKYLKQAVVLPDETIVCNFRVDSADVVFGLSPSGELTGPLYQSRVAHDLTAMGGNAYFVGIGADDIGYKNALHRTDGRSPAAAVRFLAGDTYPYSLPGLTRLSETQLLLAAAAPGEGLENELWTSDGTLEGTRRLVDIRPGDLGSHPFAGVRSSGGRIGGPFAVLNGVAYFTADDGIRGRELWQTNGTSEGTLPLKDINLRTHDSSAPTNMPDGVRTDGVRFNGLTYFVANDGIHGLELWVTDGTRPGTRLLSDMMPGPDGANPLGLVVWDGALYFTALEYDDFFQRTFRRLFRTDGTVEGTTRITSDRLLNVVGGDELEPVKVVNGRLFFFGYSTNSGANGLRLYTSDGTVAGTQAGTGVITTTTAEPEEFTVSGNYLYSHWGLADGRLLRSDGSSWEVIDAVVGPRHLVDLDGTLICTSKYGVKAVGPDGIPREIPGMPSNLFGATRLGDHVYLSGPVGGIGDGYGLWRTDGVTAELVSLPSDPFPSPLHDLAAVGGRLYFDAALPHTGYEPWVSDGTGAGTYMLADLNPGIEGSLDHTVPPSPGGGPRWIAAPNGRVYFQARTSATGSELFSTDATAAGTGLAVDLNPGPGHSTPNRFMFVGLDLYVAADAPDFGREWFRASADTKPPAVVSSRFLFEAYHELRLNFDDDVSASLRASDFTVANLTTGEVLTAPEHWTLSIGQPGQPTASGIYFRPLLDDGNYRVTLAAGSVLDAAGNPLAEDVTIDFFVLAGDANRDRTVSLADFLILRSNFGQSGKVFSEGDFNYDGQVSLADFLILRGNFGENLPPPPSASPLPRLFAGGGKDGEDDGGRRNVALLR